MKVRGFSIATAPFSDAMLDERMSHCSPRMHKASSLEATVKITEYVKTPEDQHRNVVISQYKGPPR